MLDQIKALREIKIQLEEKADKACQENNMEELKMLEFAIGSIRKAILGLNDINQKKYGSRV